MKCVGCGAKLQTNDPLQKGYINETHLLEPNAELYCKRCFDLIHYNKRYTPCIDEEALIRQIKMKLKSLPHCIICLIIDIFDLYGFLSKQIIELLMGQKVIILINKIDVLPNSIKKTAIENNIMHLALSQKLDVLAVMALSAKSQPDILKALKKLDHLAYNKRTKRYKFKHCLVMGNASVGKSTFLNGLKDVCGINSFLLTTSDQAQTTQDIIKINLGTPLCWYDTPGFINKEAFSYYLNSDSTKCLKQKGKLHVRVYQLMPDQTLLLGNLVQLDILQGIKVSLSLFIPDLLYVHRTKTINVESLKTRQTFKLLVPPTNIEEMNLLEPLTTNIIALSNDGPYDLVIGGIGFIHLMGEDVKLKITISAKIKYEMVKSII